MHNIIAECRKMSALFLILDMHVRNKKSGILSLYLTQLVNAQHKNLKTYAVLVYVHVHVYIIWSY